jgi:hypothetical protein
VGRDEDIEAIAELGRRTRKPVPRWLWIAAVVVSAVCMSGFAVVMLADRAPAAARLAPGPVHERGESWGLGIGLAIGGCAGLVIGFWIGRQRRSHSSRNSP